MFVYIIELLFYCKFPYFIFVCLGHISILRRAIRENRTEIQKMIGLMQYQESPKDNVFMFVLKTNHHFFISLQFNVSVFMEAECGFVMNQLLNTGWHVKLEWIQSCLKYFQNNMPAVDHSTVVNAVVAQLMIADYAIVGNGGLPKNVCDISRGILKTPVIVQVELAEDVSQSQRARTFNQKDSTLSKNEGLFYFF
jgi:hypothetical protein